MSEPTNEFARKKCQLGNIRKDLRHSTKNFLQFRIRFLNEHPWLRNFVQRVTQYALKTGCLRCQPCTFCGNPESQAYHPRYNEPLHVTWICNRCRPVYNHRLLRTLQLTAKESAQLELFSTFWSREVRPPN